MVTARSNRRPGTAAAAARLGDEPAGCVGVAAGDAVEVNEGTTAGDSLAAGDVGYEEGAIDAAVEVLEQPATIAMSRTPSTRTTLNLRRVDPHVSRSC